MCHETWLAFHGTNCHFQSSPVEILRLRSRLELLVFIWLDITFWRDEELDFERSLGQLKHLACLFKRRWDGGQREGAKDSSLTAA